MEYRPDDVDMTTQALLVNELVASRVGDFRDVLAGPAPEPMPQAPPEVPLCADVSLDELNELLGLGFDESSGDEVSCQFTSVEGEPGFHFAFAFLNEVGLDDYRGWIGEHEESTVAGLPAITTEQQTVIELPGGGRVLDIAVSLDESDETLSVTAADVAAALAERIVPAIPEPTIAAASEEGTAEIDLAALEAALEDDLAALESGLVGPGDPGLVVCDYVDLEAINALGILEYSEVSGLYEGICSLNQLDFEQGYHTLTVMADVGTLDDVRAWYPGAAEVTVAGQPGVVGGIELYVDTSAGTIGFFPVLPDDATAAGMQATDISIPVAELVVAAIEADAAAQ